MDLVTLAAPLLLLAVGLEALALRRRGGRPRLDEALSALGCTLLDQAINAVTLAWFVRVYGAVQRGAGLAAWSPRSAGAWAACVLAHDLGYYVFHRASHRVSVLWAAHAVHHQGEAYNLTVSLRQGALATPVTYAFYLPLALLGFPVGMFMVVHGAHQLYQFAVHTELVRTLGPLERWLATPAHHRVHHGRDAEHLDRNFGGFLIVWDRLLGTFAPATRAPRYGVTEGLPGWSPVRANLAPFVALARRCLAAPRGRRWAVALGPPGGGRPGPSVYGRPDLSQGRGYLLAQGLLAGLAVLGWQRDRAQGAGAPAWLVIAAVAAAVVTGGAWLDRRRWARAAERWRLSASLAGALAWWAGSGARTGPVLVALGAAASLAWLRRVG